MKYLIVLFSLTLLIACSENETEPSAASMTTPLAVGNAWNYFIHYTSESIPDQTQKIEITSTVTIDGKTIYIIDDSESGWVERSDRYEQVELSGDRTSIDYVISTLPKNPKVGETVQNIEWLRTEEITVDAGTFTCWVGKYVNTRSYVYYASGVGKVMCRHFALNGEISETVSLTSYELH